LNPGSIGALAVMGLISGAVLGGAQGLVLAKQGRGLAVPWALAMPVIFALGWCASTGIGVDVDDQFTVFGAAGALVFTLLSGLAARPFYSCTGAGRGGRANRVTLGPGAGVAFVQTDGRSLGSVSRRLPRTTDASPRAPAPPG
jgi:hypothetical protein